MVMGALLAALGSMDSELELVEGAGCFHRENKGEEVGRRILGFLGA
jgi:hypothetical protein